jgi:dUTP pyrophosphatase
MRDSVIDLKFTKIRDVQSPRKSCETDAGIDFFVPRVSDDYISQLKSRDVAVIVGDYARILVPPHYTVVIPSGVYVDIPSGWSLVAFNRSGIATKKGLVLMACVVDSGYQGEVFFSLKNMNRFNTWIDFDSPIVQMLLLPVPDIRIEEVDGGPESLYNGAKSTRGTGALGSTG